MAVPSWLNFARSRRQRRRCGTPSRLRPRVTAYRRDVVADLFASPFDALPGLPECLDRDVFDWVDREA